MAGLAGAAGVAWALEEAFTPLGVLVGAWISFRWIGGKLLKWLDYIDR